MEVLINFLIESALPLFDLSSLRAQVHVGRPHCRGTVGHSGCAHAPRYAELPPS